MVDWVLTGCGCDSGVEVVFYEELSEWLVGEEFKKIDIQVSLDGDFCFRVFSLNFIDCFLEVLLDCFAILWVIYWVLGSSV